MRIAVMQPYFLPYLGYFRLMHEVDKFIIFDNAQMIKRSWIVRNRFSPCKSTIFKNDSTQAPITISLPIIKSSQTSLISEQKHAADKYFINKTIKRLGSWYPNSNDSFSSLIHTLFHLLVDSRDLVDVLEAQLKVLSRFLNINEPEILRSSKVLPRVNYSNSFEINGAQDYIIDICHKLGATTYINLPNGRDLYAEPKFSNANLLLKFIDFKKPVELTPLFSALHYAYFQESLAMDLMHKYWFLSNA